GPPPPVGGGLGGGGPPLLRVVDLSAAWPLPPPDGWSRVRRRDAVVVSPARPCEAGCVRETLSTRASAALPGWFPQTRSSSRQVRPAASHVREAAESVSPSTGPAPGPPRSASGNDGHGPWPSSFP